MPQFTLSPYRSEAAAAAARMGARVALVSFAREQIGAMSCNPAIGGLGKFILWIFLWNGVSTAGRIGGWIGIALVLALIGGFILYRRSRRYA